MVFCMLSDISWIFVSVYVHTKILNTAYKSSIFNAKHMKLAQHSQRMNDTQVNGTDFSIFAILVLIITSDPPTFSIATFHQEMVCEGQGEE